MVAQRSEGLVDSMQYQITVTFATDTEGQAEALLGIINNVAPFIVDNVGTDLLQLAEPCQHLGVFRGEVCYDCKAMVL